LRVFCTDAASFGSVLVQATGSREWLEALGAVPPSLSSEEQVFEALKLPFVPAYWREKEHIGLPVPQATLQPPLRGLIHVHSTYSDGSATLRQMAEAALGQGLEYMVICDHSQTASYAGGLRPADVRRQWAEIEALNAELAPFRILRGIESDILPDGSLDYPDELLAQFEVVVGSLHAGLNLGRSEQTQRLLRALDNPYLSILGHPSGRLLLRRKGAEADWEAVLERAQQNHKVVEFNCSPYRLDLDWRLMLAWRDRLHFSLGPDASRPDHQHLARRTGAWAQEDGLALGVGLGPYQELGLALQKGPQHIGDGDDAHQPALALDRQPPHLVLEHQLGGRLEG
jgi:DNA polymerase (family 10)